MGDKAVFDNRRVAAAVRTQEDFHAALESKVDVIFLLYSNILTVGEDISKAHEAGKKVLVIFEVTETCETYAYGLTRGLGVKSRSIFRSFATEAGGCFCRAIAPTKTSATAVRNKTAIQARRFCFIPQVCAKKRINM